MTSVLSAPTDTPDIEFASRDRISTLQLERLRWSLQHAYDNVPHYTKAFDDAGVHPTDLKDLSDLAKFPFTAIGKAHGLGEAVGFVKLIADSAHNEILGVHMIGPDVTELLPELTLAQLWDLTADEVARNIHAHPTLSEGLLEAAHGISGHMINL